MRSLSVYESHKIRRLIKNERKARRTALVSDSKRGELGWLLPKREFKNAQLTLWEPCNKRLMIYRIAQNRSDRCCVRVVPALRSVRRFQSEDSGMLRAYDLPKSAPWMRNLGAPEFPVTGSLAQWGLASLCRPSSPTPLFTPFCCHPLHLWLLFSTSTKTL